MDIILLVIVAVWLIFKLFSIIGQDLGGNLDGFKEISQNQSGKEKQTVKSSQEERENTLVIDVPDTPASPQRADLIKKIQSFDSTFLETDFLQGAVGCFKTVLQAFSRCDKATLKGLLLKKIYAIFAADIDDRLQQGKRSEKQIVAIVKTNIESFKHTRKSIDVSVRFVTDQLCVLYDKHNRVIQGHPNDVVRLEDVWVFTRSLKEKKSNWYLKETL